jgi:hypothetical protein
MGRTRKSWGLCACVRGRAGLSYFIIYIYIIQYIKVGQMVGQGGPLVWLSRDRTTTFSLEHRKMQLFGFRQPQMQRYFRPLMRQEAVVILAQWNRATLANVVAAEL